MNATQAAIPPEPIVRRGLASPDETERVCAAAWCASSPRLAESLRPVLIARLADPSPQVRELFAIALGMLDVLPSAELGALLHAGEDVRVRRAAVSAIARAEADDLTPELRGSCEDEDPSVRTATAIALGKGGASRAAAAAAAVGSADLNARLTGLRALAMQGETAKPHAETVLPRAEAENAGERAAACAALLAMDEPSGVGRTHAMLTGSPADRAEITDALSWVRVRLELVRDGLRACALDDDSLAAGRALLRLARLPHKPGDEAAIGSGLEHAEAGVRQCACVAAASVDRASVLKGKLETISGDPREPAREHALSALQTLAPERS